MAKREFFPRDQRGKSRAGKIGLSDHYTFLGNCPLKPTLTLTSHLGQKGWLRGGVGGQFPARIANENT